VRHKKEPHRQCIGCRKVQPKKELLRLVLLPAGKIVFDPQQTKDGRGMYLCPDQRCFSLAYKNSRWKKYLLENKDLQDFFHGIHETMSSSIEYYFALGIKMKYLEYTNDDPGTLQREDVIVINSGVSKEQKNRMYAAVQEKGTEIVTIPGNCMNDAPCVTVKNRFPMISRFTRDLRIFERLSSKGLVL